MEELLDRKYQLLHEATMTREKLGGRRIPKLPEPTHKYTHRDYLLDEMKWLAADVIEERKHKRALGFVLVSELRDYKATGVVSEPERDTATKSLCRRLSNMVQVFFAEAVRDFKDKAEKRKKPGKPQWRIYDFSTANEKVSIFLEKVKSPEPTEEKSQAQPISRYAALVARQHSFSKPSILQEKEASEPSTPTAAALDTDSSEFPSHFPLFYDFSGFDSIENDLKKHLEPLQSEDIDIYGPSNSFGLEYRDIRYEDDLIDREIYTLLPDPDEYMLFETAKTRPEEKSELPAIVRYQTEFYQFPTQQSKKNWKIFEDLELERIVCEFGGHWELVSDLLGLSRFTTYDFYSPEECAQRWGTLQKRKDRTVAEDFRPNAVLHSLTPPECDIAMNFSLFPFRTRGTLTRGNVEISYKEREYADLIDFIQSNGTFKTNCYFENYEQINCKYYVGQATESPYCYNADTERASICQEFNIKKTTLGEPARTQTVRATLAKCSGELYCAQNFKKKAEQRARATVQLESGSPGAFRKP